MHAPALLLLLSLLSLVALSSSSECTASSLLWLGHVGDAENAAVVATPHPWLAVSGGLNVYAYDLQHNTLLTDGLYAGPGAAYFLGLQVLEESDVLLAVFSESDAHGSQPYLCAADVRVFPPKLLPIFALQGETLPNGMTRDPHTGAVYITNSSPFHGTIDRLQVQVHRDAVSGALVAVNVTDYQFAWLPHAVAGDPDGLRAYVNPRTNHTVLFFTDLGKLRVVTLDAAGNAVDQAHLLYEHFTVLDDLRLVSLPDEHNQPHEYLLVCNFVDNKILLFDVVWSSSDAAGQAPVDVHLLQEIAAGPFPSSVTQHPQQPDLIFATIKGIIHEYHSNFGNNLSSFTLQCPLQTKR